MEAEMKVVESQTKKPLKEAKAERAGTESPLELLKRAQPLVLDVWPPEQWGNQFLLLLPPRLC